MQSNLHTIAKINTVVNHNLTYTGVQSSFRFFRSFLACRCFSSRRFFSTAALSEKMIIKSAFCDELSNNIIRTLFLLTTVWGMVRC